MDGRKKDGRCETTESQTIRSRTQWPHFKGGETEAWREMVTCLTKVIQPVGSQARAQTHICLLVSTQFRALSLTSGPVLIYLLQLLSHNDDLACLYSQNSAKLLVSSLLWKEVHILRQHLQKARDAGSLHEGTCYSTRPSSDPRGVSVLPPEGGPGQATPEKHCLMSSLPGVICWNKKKCLFFNIMQHPL